MWGLGHSASRPALTFVRRESDSYYIQTCSRQLNICPNLRLAGSQVSTHTALLDTKRANLIQSTLPNESII